jgi:hypothetical protein
MGKIKEDQRLTHVIGVRVSEIYYNKLEGLRKNSNCQTLAEFARMILQREEIIWYHKDIGQEAIAVELTAIRRELKAIGTNVNQVTRYFHGSNLPSQKIFEALKILDEYKKVQGIIDPLFAITDKLISTWSPK